MWAALTTFEVVKNRDGLEIRNFGSDLELSTLGLSVYEFQPENAYACVRAISTHIVHLSEPLIEQNWERIRRQ